MANFTEETVSVAGSNLQVYRGGTGDPLLVLHGAGGNAGPRRYAQALAEKFTVYLPSHPGYGLSDRPSWVESMQDLACFYTWFQEQEGLENIRAIGFSMGGWLAAEMLSMTRHAFSKVMLVGAAGIKPEEGEITDIFIISPAQVRELVYHDPSQVPEWDEMFGSPSDAGAGQSGGGRPGDGHPAHLASLHVQSAAAGEVEPGEYPNAHRVGRAGCAGSGGVRRPVPAGPGRL